MAEAWTKKEIEHHRKVLKKLYVQENKTISEIADKLGISQSTVFDRMKKLSIKSTPYLKKHYRNSRTGVKIPSKFSADLAEFIGIMLGDGSLTHFQVVVTLGNKEIVYARYVCDLIKKLFGIEAKIGVRVTGYCDVYIGSVRLTSYLFKMGLVRNKVKSQVDVPVWIMTKPEYMRACLRGFFDTDGSVYKLRFGNQISLCNASLPLLKSLQLMLLRLEYRPSSISLKNVYLTRRQDLKRFFEEIGSNHPKKRNRLKRLVEDNMRRSDSGYSRRL